MPGLTLFTPLALVLLMSTYALAQDPDEYAKQLFCEQQYDQCMEACNEAGVRNMETCNQMPQTQANGEANPNYVQCVVGVFGTYMECELSCSLAYEDCMEMPTVKFERQGEGDIIIGEPAQRRGDPVQEMYDGILRALKMNAEEKQKVKRELDGILRKYKAQRSRRQ